MELRKIIRLSAEADGERLQARRTALGMTQKQLAELASCDQATISAVELGLRVPRDIVKARLAMALACEIDSIWQYPDRKRIVLLLDGDPVAA